MAYWKDAPFQKAKSCTWLRMVSVLSMMHHPQTAFVAYFVFISLAIFAICSSTQYKLDLRDVRKYIQGPTTSRRSSSVLDIHSARQHGQDPSTRRGSYRDQEERPIPRSLHGGLLREHEQLHSQMLVRRQSDTQQQLSKRMWPSKEVERKAKDLEHQAEDFRQRSGSYRWAVDLLKSGVDTVPAIKQSYFSARMGRAKAYTGEIQRLRLAGRASDADRLNSATHTYLMAWSKSWDDIVADAHQHRTKNTPISKFGGGGPTDKPGSSGSVIRRNTRSERLVKRTKVSENVDIRARVWEMRARTFRLTAGVYQRTVHLAKFTALSGHDLETAYFRQLEAQSKIYAREIAQLEQAGQIADAIRYQKATNAFLNAWRRNWQHVYEDAGRDPKAVIRRPSSPSTFAREQMFHLKGELTTHDDPRILEQRPKNPTKSSLGQMFYFTGKFPGLKVPARQRTVSPMKYDTSLPSLGDGTFGSTGAFSKGQNVDSSNSDHEGMSRPHGSKSPNDDESHGHIFRRGANIERRAPLPDHNEILKRAKDMEYMAVHFRESKIYKRAIELGTRRELNESKMGEVYFEAMHATEQRYNKIASDLRSAWRRWDAETYRKAADMVLHAWHANYDFYVAEVRSLTAKSADGIGTSKSRGYGGLKRGFLLPNDKTGR